MLELLNFVAFALQAKNAKVAQTASIVGFNALLCFKGNKALLKNEIQRVMETALEALKKNIDPIETDSLLAVVLLLCRCLYENPDAVEYANGALFSKALWDFVKKPLDQKVKDAVSDVTQLLG